MDLFLHVRVLFSILLGLGVSKLLGGVARIVQHPKQHRVYWVHLAWAFYLFLYLIHFWWWEFRLSNVVQWTFPLYVFVAIYAVLLYLLCTLMFPDEMSDYSSYEDYFYSRKQWFFGLMALLFVVDVGDTLIKGLPYLRFLGFVYYFRTVALMVMSLAAIKINNRTFHAAFVVIALICEVGFILAAHLRF